MLQDFLVAPGGLENTPSRKDGLNEEVESNLRIYGCELIQQAGILLRLPQVVMATGQVLFNRFYYRVSFVRHEAKSAAIAALFLACKSEEVPKKLRDMCNVWYRLDLRREKKTDCKPRYWWKRILEDEK